MTEIVIPLSPTTHARMQLVAERPTGPYRLTVEHPAMRLVEYFDTVNGALRRWNDLEAVLRGSHRTEWSPAA